MCFMLSRELSTTSRAQPVFIEPMQVVPVAELPDGAAWSYEANLDGYRCFAAKRGSGVVLWSRNGNGFTERFPQIVRAYEKWAQKGIPAEAAMLAAGHSSVQMHNRYIHLQRSDVAKAFGILPTWLQHRFSCQQWQGCK